MDLIDQRRCPTTGGPEIAVGGDDPELTNVALAGDVVDRHRGSVSRPLLAALTTPFVDPGEVRRLDTRALAVVTGPTAGARHRGAQVTIRPAGRDRCEGTT